MILKAFRSVKPIHFKTTRLYWLCNHAQISRPSRKFLSCDVPVKEFSPKISAIMKLITDKGNPFALKVLSACNISGANMTLDIVDKNSEYKKSMLLSLCLR